MRVVSDWLFVCTVKGMTPEERERMNKLCAAIQVEKDHAKFTELITELNALFEAKEQRLNLREQQQNNVDGGA
jgi:hypothetical protein